jgi:hypothetical protein
MMTEICYSEDSVQKLTYMIDFFQKLNNLKTSMQGPQVNILTQNDEIKTCIKN